MTTRKKKDTPKAAAASPNKAAVAQVRKIVKDETLAAAVRKLAATKMSRDEVTAVTDEAGLNHGQVLRVLREARS